MEGVTGDAEPPSLKPMGLPTVTLLPVEGIARAGIRLGRAPPAPAPALPEPPLLPLLMPLPPLPPLPPLTPAVDGEGLPSRLIGRTEGVVDPDSFGVPPGAVPYRLLPEYLQRDNGSAYIKSLAQAGG